MLKTEILAPGVLKIVAPETLHAEDFLAVSPQVDAIIKDFGEIRVLIDASHLEGWDSLTTLEKHAGFIKAHQKKVARIAVIARRDWQHWLVGAVKVFLDPEVKVFDPGHEDEAARWIGKADANVVASVAGQAVERRVAEIVDRH
jgi:hypothetical protein